MFYTGVTERPGAPGAEQRIGIATSTDLMTWNRLDAPIYSCRDVPWAWCDTTNNNNGFRDPFVMRDPAAPGQWLMYYTTYPLTDTGGMLVGVAASSGDLTQWHDLMPLWFTNRAYSFSSVVESPHLFKHGDTWFMFVTVNAGQPISYYTTPNPTGPDGVWTNRGRLSTMLGFDTHSWYASEYFADGLNDYFAYVNFNRVEIYKMYWTGPLTFQLFEPGDFHIQSLTWSADSVIEGAPETLSVVATGWSGREVELAAYEQLPGGGEATIPMDSLGIPAALPLDADTTRFTWPSRIFHASGATIGSVSFVLRVTDLTAASKPVTVVPPPPFQVHGMSWSADSTLSGTPVTLSVAATSWAGHALALEAVERLSGGQETPLLLDSLELPATLPLTADTTRLTWDARIRRPSGDTTTTLDLELRTTDHAVTAPILRIAALPPPPPPFAIHALRWSADSVWVGDPVTLSVAATGWSGQSVQLVPVERLAGGGEVALEADSLGLPGVLPLTADTTRFIWDARIRRVSGDTTTALRLVLQNPDFALETPVLKVAVPVGAPPLKVQRIAWSTGLASSSEAVTLEIVASDWSGHSATLSAFERLPSGADSALTIGDLGLPAVLALSADTTRLTWSARIRRASGDTTGTQRLIIRATDDVESQPLSVVMQQVAGGSSGEEVPIDRLPRIRRLALSVYGELPSFLVDLPRAAHVRLDVYDLMGRRVRTVTDRDLPPGATVVAWDGRNAGGGAADRGLYFVRFTTPSVSRTVKVVLTRPVGSP